MDLPSKSCAIATSLRRRWQSVKARKPSLYILVMPGLVPGIHVFLDVGSNDVDGRDKPGHDDNSSLQRRQ
jgi:hypothetical protein